MQLESGVASGEYVLLVELTSTLETPHDNKRGSIRGFVPAVPLATYSVLNDNSVFTATGIC